MSTHTPLNTHDPEFRFAIQAVQAAAAIVRQVQQEMSQGTTFKADHSPVTVGDLASQALIGRLLLESFHGDALVGEEDSDYLRTAAGAGLLAAVTGFTRRHIPAATLADVCEWIDRGRSEGGDRFWTLDPIDGTKGFLRGGQYAVALALIVAGEVRLGVMACPGIVNGREADLSGEGSIIAAARGQGCWFTSLSQPGEFSQLQVSSIAEPAQARILRSYEDKHTDSELTQRIAGRLGVEVEPVRMDSQAKYAVLAAGGGDVMLRLLSKEQPHYREKIWDQAAGSIVVEEAGGRISDLDGQALDFSTGRQLTRNRGILASNGRLHEALLAALSALGA